MKRLLLILLVLLGARTARAQMPATCVPGTNVYYISSAIGLDSRTQAQAKSKATPWQHSPRMANFTGSYSHTAGDCIVLRGGDTWTAASFPMSINVGGSSSSVLDYFGADLTWFAGGSFVKPLFDAAGAAIVPMVGINASNVTLSTLEIANPTFNGSGGGFGGACSGGSVLVHVSSSAQNVTVDSAFLHDWKVPNPISAANHAVGAMCDDFFASGGNHNVVLSNSEVRDDGAGNAHYFGVCGRSIAIVNTHCHFLSEGIVSEITVNGSEFDHLTGYGSLESPSGTHTNIIETDTGGSGDGPIYNNLIHENSTEAAVITAFSISVYNNLIYKVYNSGIFCTSGQTATGSEVCNMYNNVVDTSLVPPGVGSCPGSIEAGSPYCTGTFSPLRYGLNGSPTPIIIKIQNNQAITAATVFYCDGCTLGAGTSVVSNNLPQTTTVATTQGYTAATKYQASGDTTTFAGLNLTSIVGGSLSALGLDAEGTTWFGATAVARPTGATKWNPGAYQFPFSGGGTPPVVSVAVTGPGCPSACSGTATITVTATGGTISSVQPQLDGTTFGTPCVSSPCAVPWDTTQSANGAHTVGGTATNGTGQGTATPVSVTVNNVTPGCMTGGSTWSNTSFTPQSSAFSVSFTLQPFGTPISGTGGPVAALSQTPATSYTSNSALVRQSDNGNWQVFNGSTGIYQAATLVAWQVGTKATFTVTVDFVAQTYSVQVSQGITNSVLAVNYPFRAAATSLGFINLDPETPPVTLQLCAFTLLSPTLSFSPSPAAFGNQTVSTTSSPLTVTVSNTGTGPQVLATPYFTISGTNAANFANTGTGTCANGGTIPASGSCTVNLTFTPSFTGPRAANLTINGTVFASDTLTGTGTSPVIAIAPSPVAFGSQSVGGTSAPVTVTVSNTGTASEILSTPFFSITGTNASDFARSGGTCANAGTIAASSSCTILLTFTPGAVGSRTANLNIIGTVNAIASITGTGTQAALTITPSPGAFGNQNVNTTSGALTITVTNSGTSSQTLGTPFFTLTGTNATDFSRTGGTCTNGGTIAASGSCTVLLTFTPPIPGARTGTLNILGTVNGSDSLTGTGIAAALSLSPTSIAFGNQTTGTSSGTHAVVLTNTGTATLNISSIALTGANPGEFSTSFFLDNFVNLNNWNISNNPAPGGGNFQTAYADISTGMLRLKVTQDGTTAGSIGGEIFSNQLFGFGRFDCTMRASSTAVTPNGAGTAVSGQVTACFNFINNSQTEIDSPEIEGQTPNVLEFTNYSGVSNNQTSSTTAGFQPDQGFHKYSFIWSSTQIQFLVDDVLASTHTLDIPTVPAFAYFNHWGTNSASFGGLATAGVTRYMYVSKFQFSNGSTCGATLAPSTSCTLNVVFSPTSLGGKSASLTVVSDASSSPDNVTLTGTGVAPAVPVLSFSPGLGAFGNQLVNTTSAPLTITVSNVGTATEVLGTPFFTLTGPNAADFTRTAGTCVNGGSIAVNGSCTITLTFSPSATGGRAAALNVLGTANSSAALSGIGTLPVIGLSPSPGAFGNQLQGTTSAPLTITVSNTGTAAEVLATPFFTITGTNATNFVRTGGTCVNAGSIAASASCTVILTFTPSATGARSATLNIQGTVNASDSLTGTGTLPVIGLSPSPVAFGNQVVGTTSGAITVTVSNTGTETETLNTPFFTISGTNAADFARSGGTCTNAGTIAASASCTVLFTFTPSAGGSRTAQLNIAGTVNATAGMTGTGTQAALTLTPSPAAFGNQNVSTTSSPLTITVTNNGTAATTLGTPYFTLTGTNAANFANAGTGTCANGATIAQAGSCTVDLTFTPSASGARTGTLNILGSVNASDSLTGTGVASVVSLSPTTIAFGNQTTGTSSGNHAVTLTNTGTATLGITSITLTGANSAEFSTNSSTCGATLAAAASCTLNVVFSPTTIASKTASLTFTTDAASSPDNVSLTGAGVAPAVPALSFSPTPAAFGNQSVNTTSAPITVTVSNIGTASEVLNTPFFTITGANSADFSRTGGTCANAGTIAAAGSCTVILTFTPSASGSRTATLNISGTANGSNALTGTGTQPVLAIAPSPVAFGNQTQGTTSAPIFVTVSNTGTAPQVLSTPYFTITGSGATSFANAGTGNCTNGGTIAVGASCSINLTFTPSVTGSLAATLNILGTVNGTNGLTGTGVPLSGVVLDPTSIAFGNQDQGTTSAPTAVTLLNSGGATLTITSITIAGTNPSQFSINTNTCGATVAAGGSCTWNVVFSPTLVQSSAANVTVISNSATSPDLVTLTGTGRTPTPPTTPAPAITIVSILPAGSVVLSATGSPVTPRNVLASDAGCSQDGVTYTNPCKFSISCGNCSNKTKVWFNGVSVSQSYFKGIVTASVPIGLIPIPTVKTDYQLALAN